MTAASLSRDIERVRLAASRIPPDNRTEGQVLANVRSLILQARALGFAPAELVALPGFALLPVAIAADLAALAEGTAP